MIPSIGVGDGSCAICVSLPKLGGSGVLVAINVVVEVGDGVIVGVGEGIAVGVGGAGAIGTISLLCPRV